MSKSPYFADLSDNNDLFNAAEYRHAGHVIVALKASEGVGEVDTRHREWALQAGMNGITVIHYHFGRPDLHNGADEAAWFLHVTAGLRGPRDYLVYDGERASDGRFGLDPEHCAEFDTHIQKETRFHTILYASASELVAHGEHALVGDNKRDWCAAYGTGGDSAAPGHRCVIRQFTDGVLGPEPHSLPGVGRADIDVLRGTFGRNVLSASR